VASREEAVRQTAAWSLAFAVAASLALAGHGDAGPEKVTFPADWKSHALYTTVDRYDNKQYRELYASSANAVQAMKAGNPLPHGTVLTMVSYKAQVDSQGSPVKDADGRFVKADMVAIAVMEKQAGWGTEYPPDLRNGEWEYAIFTPDGKLNEKANYKGCFTCHKPHEKQDFVISLAKVAATTPAAVVMKSGPTDVNIAGFAFSPATLSIDTGQRVTWTNGDDSPHQITLARTRSGRRSSSRVRRMRTRSPRLAGTSTSAACTRR
jgi:plastocyanin